MDLADKMFSRGNIRCPLRSECTQQWNEKYYEALFKRDWSVFVIKHDSKTNTYDWFTQCCEDPKARHFKPENLPAPCS
jgi:hypothetical protein